MRKVFSIGTILSLAIMFIACNNTTPQNRLKEEINELQHKLPISLGKTGDIVDVTYDVTTNLITYSMEISDEHLFRLKMDIDIERLNRLSSENIIYASHGLECIDFMNLIVEVGASLRYSYRTTFFDSSRTYSSDFSPEILKNRLSSKGIQSFNSTESKNALSNDIQQLNEELPMSMEDGILAKSVKEEKNNVVFLFELDAAKYSLEDVDDYVSIRFFFDNFSPLRPLLFDCNYGVIIRMQLSTGESKDIAISPFEIYTFG